jgi:FtsZ-binding cell division protein ZapB
MEILITALAPVATGILGWLTGRRKQKNDFITDLQKSIDLLAAKNTELVETVMQLRQQNIELSAQVTQLRRENKVLQRQLAALNEKIKQNLTALPPQL